MKIENYLLHLDDGEKVELPRLPYDTSVRVWVVPQVLCPNGYFVGIGNEIPGCDHSDHVFEEVLPAHPEAVLAGFKTKKNAQINEWRLAANQSTFPYQGKQFACDVLSRSDIDGVANSINLTGQFPAGFPNAWKAVDNTYLPITTTKDFITFYQAMTAQGSANFAKAQQLKAELAAANSVEEVESIIWQ